MAAISPRPPSTRPLPWTEDPPPTCRHCLHRHHCLPAGLAQRALDALDQVLERPPPVFRGHRLWAAGDGFDALYVVRAGVMMAFDTTARGDRAVAFHLPGDLFGFSGLANGRHPYGVTALDTGTLCRLPYDAWLGLCTRHPGLQANLDRIVGAQLLDLKRMLGVFGYRTGRERVALLMLHLGERARRMGGNPRHFLLPASRLRLGQYLAMAKETLSRTFSELQRAGLLQVDGQEIQLLDPDGLAETAGLPPAWAPPRRRRGGWG